VLFVELATLGFALIAWGGLPPARLLAPLLLGMLGGQLAIGATNELVDLPFDAVAKPNKPLPRGDVSVGGARTMVLVGLILMVGFGLLLGLPAFALLALGTGLGLIYDLWLKRTAWSWLPYLLALPLLPIWVFLALGRPEPRLLLLYPLGALAAIGVHFAQALPDVATDRATGQATATSRLDSRAVFILAWLAALSAPMLALAAAARLGEPRSQATIVAAAALALLLLLVNLGIFAANPRHGAAACFPLVALSTLASGLAWTLTVAR
jgi:4-hydroxybenzoate polyprenyltransferase